MNHSSIYRIKALLLLFFTMLYLASFSQTNDPKATISGRSDGIITKADLLKAEKLIPNVNDLKIIYFSMSYTINEDDVVELSSSSDMLTQEMKDHISKLKAGTTISFENIKAKRGLETIIIEAVNLIIKD